MKDLGRVAQGDRWQPPPELARLRPRLVRLSVAGKAAAAGAAALLIGAMAAGISLYVIAERDLARVERLRQEGVSTQAEVVELGRARGEGARFFAVYQYTARQRLQRGRVNFARRDWQKLQVGSPLEVRYLPSQPERSWLPGREPKGVPLWVVPMLPACLGLAVWPIAYHLRKQWRLLEEGRPALARVTHTKRFSHGPHGGTGHRVHYEFQILSGARRTGSYDTTKDPPASGAMLVILYDPEDASCQGRHPLSLVRAG